MKITNTEAIADSNMWITRKGSANYYKACTLLVGETESDFKEISDEEYNKIQEEEQAKYNLM